MLNVGDLLEGLDVRLLCGEAGTGRPVRWVHISELPDPTPFLSGGEVLLTTGMALEDEAEQRDYVDRLAEHGLAALGFGTGVAHDEVPPALLETATARGFPVFEVPYEVPFLAITESAFTRLVNEQYAVVRRALAAQEKLERIVLAERGLPALAEALARTIGATVLILDPRGELLTRHDVGDGPSAEVLATLAGEARDRGTRVDGAASERTYTLSLGDGSAGLALSVTAGRDEEPEAWLMAIKARGPLTDFDRLILQWAVTLIALELLRVRVAGDTERRLAGDVLAGLVAGELRGSELARRLEPFGLRGQVAVLACACAGVKEEALETAIRQEGQPCLAAEVEGLVCAVLPELAEDEALALARRVGDRIAARARAPVRLGLGRAVAAGEARRSLCEAKYALESLSISSSHNGDGAGAEVNARVASFRDIGAFGLLLSLQDDDSLRVFCDSILEPIESSRGAYRDELIRSLEAFIEENGQWERTAKRLDCHRHTLRYRIRRVEELTGRDLDNARDRIDFWLALRGRELVR